MSRARPNPYRSCAGMARTGTRQTGLTLLELMIALSLGLLLVAGIGTIYVGSNRTYRVQEQNARIQESGRYALEVIGRSVRQAGYWDMPLGATATAIGFGGTPVGGTNGSGTASDTVTVQYDGVVGSTRDCEGNNVTAAGVVQDGIRLNGTDLQCDGNVDGTVDHQPLVSNVEDLQFLYGVDTDGNQSANLYTATPANWNQVVSVRACVLIRSELPAITEVAQTYLNCAGALGTATGSGAVTTATASDNRRLHRAFVATFNLRNRVTNLP
jgi:type IV pilus assembly protein PilW